MAKDPIQPELTRITLNIVTLTPMVTWLVSSVKRLKMGSDKPKPKVMSMIHKIVLSKESAKNQLTIQAENAPMNRHACPICINGW